MRLKDVPNDVVEGTKGLFKNKWVLYGGIAVVALVGGYIFLQNQSSNSDGGSVTIGTPIGYGNNTGSGSVTPTSVSGSGSGTIDPTTAALLQQASDQNNNQLTGDLASITANADVAIAQMQSNFSIAQLGAQVANYSASATALDQFIKSSPGELLSVGGSITPSGQGGLFVDLHDLTYKKGVNLTAANNLLKTFDQQLAATGFSPNAVQPTPTQPNNTSSSSGNNATTGQTSPSNIFSTINSAILGGSGISALH